MKDSKWNDYSPKRPEHNDGMKIDYNVPYTACSSQNKTKFQIIMDNGTTAGIFEGILPITALNDMSSESGQFKDWKDFSDCLNLDYIIRDNKIIINKKGTK